MHVEIHELQDDGSERVVAVFRCQGDHVSCDNPTIWNHLIQATGGTVVGERGRRFTPRDGEDYLHNLRYQYRGPYLYAREVEDDEVASGSDSFPELVSAERAVVVEIPEDARERTLALERSLFLLSVFWGACEIDASIQAQESITRLLESEVGLTTTDAFDSEDLRIRLNQARHGVTPPPVVPRLAGKADREWQRLITALQADEKLEALIHAQLLGEYLRTLGNQLHPWLDQIGMSVPPEGTTIGVRAGEAETAWEELGWSGAEEGNDAMGFLDMASRRSDRALKRAERSAPRGELLKAMIALRQAVGYTPAINEGRTLLGEVLHRMEHPRAESEIRKALYVETVRNNPSLPLQSRLRCMLHMVRQREALARCLLAAGQTAAARDELLEALYQLHEVLDHGGSGTGVSEEELRAVQTRQSNLIANIEAQSQLVCSSMGVDGPQVGQTSRSPHTVRRCAENAAGVAGPLASGEDSGHTD